jgi:hypothetical protein
LDRFEQTLPIGYDASAALTKVVAEMAMHKDFSGD